MDVVTLAAAKANAAKQIEEAMQGGGAVAGKSAYEIAVDEGFSGTEEEWLASLHGTDGSDGYNPTIVEKTSTDDEYVLTVTYKDGSGTVQSYDTPNLKGSGGAGSAGYEVLASVTADGVKTYKQICYALAQDFFTGSIDTDAKYELTEQQGNAIKTCICTQIDQTHAIFFVSANYFDYSGNGMNAQEFIISTTENDNKYFYDDNGTKGNGTSVACVSGRIYSIIKRGSGSSSHKVLGTVTSDGVKTWAALLKDLWDACQANGGFDTNKKYELRVWFSETTNCFTVHQSFFGDDSISFTNSVTNLDSANHYFTVNTVQISSTASKNIWENITQKTNGQTYANSSNSVQGAGTRLEIIEV